MTVKPLPDDEYEEAPIERVLRRAMLEEAARSAQASTEEASAVPEAATPPPLKPVAEAPQQAAARAAEEQPQAAAPITEAPSQVAPPPAQESQPQARPMPAQEAPPAQAPTKASVEGTSSMPAPDMALPAGTTAEAVAAWTEALRAVEQSVNQATDALHFLRATVKEMAPLLRSIEGLEDVLSRFSGQSPNRAEPDPLQYGDENGGGFSERDWIMERRRAAAQEKATKQEAVNEWATAGPPRPSAKPVTLVPESTPARYSYRVTVEDRKGPVDLIQLHRALGTVQSVRNLSLLNYVGGVASLSLETMEEVQPAELENAVKKVMKRDCSVVPHESNVMLLQMGD